MDCPFCVPSLLTDEEILKASEADTFIPNGEVDFDTGYLTSRKQVAQAQRESDIRYYEGK